MSVDVTAGSSTTAAVAGGGVCPVHLAVAATGTCGRCGRFVCRDCVFYRREEKFEPRCTECVLRSDLADAQKQLPRIKRGLPVWIALIGVVLLVAGGASAASGLDSHRASDFIVPFLVFLCGAAALVCDVVLVRTWSPLWAWAALGASALPMVGGMLLVQGGGCWTLLLVLLVVRLSVGAYRLSVFQQVLARAAERPELFESRPDQVP